MQKFKVGDKVRVKTQEGKINTYFDDINALGTVVKYPDKFSYTHFPEEVKVLVAIGDAEQTVHVEDLELAEEPKVTHKFKVGDRVVGNSNALSHRIGDTGIINGLGYSGGYWVTFDSDSTTNWVCEEEIDPIEEKPVIDTSNPNKKTWSEMTPDEKGALLLAHHEGKVIEHHYREDVWFVTDHDGPHWFGNLAYRVKPKPVVNQVNLFSNRGLKFSDIMSRDSAYKITYQTVYGEPDWSTIKGETL